jgi:hypothetical protein
MFGRQDADVGLVVVDLVPAEVLRISSGWAAAEKGSSDAEDEEPSSHGPVEVLPQT